MAGDGDHRKRLAKKGQQMKTEALKALGLTEEQIAEVMKENGKDIETTKAKFADHDNIKEQLAEASRAIESFKAMDIDGIKAAAEEWKTKAAQAEKDASDKIAEMEFNTMLDSAITAAGGRSAKVVRAALDVDTLRGSSNRDSDIKTALETLKTESDYLFASEAPPPFAAGTGSAPVATKYSPETNAIRAAAGLKTE